MNEHAEHVGPTSTGQGGLVEQGMNVCRHHGAGLKFVDRQEESRTDAVRDCMKLLLRS